MELIIILILILYLSIRSLLYLNKDNPYYHDEVRALDQIRDQFQSGDIIFFGGRHEPLEQPVFRGYMMGHVGLILREEDGRVYVLECTSRKHYGDQKAFWLNSLGMGGVRLIELEEILDHYHHKTGQNVFATRLISRGIPREIVRSNLEKYRGVIFESKIKIYLSVILDVLVSHKLADAYCRTHYRMMCGEFVLHFLYNCGVIHASNCPRARIFWPHFFATPYFDKITFIKYSPLIKFSFK